jgi:hypothetical protein
MSAPSAQRRRRGRFDSGFTKRELWDIVEEVAGYVAAQLGIDPTTVPMSRFDSGRGHAGRPDAPTARAICNRLKLRWPVLLERVFSPTRNATMSLAAHARNEPTDHLSDSYLFYALRRAAAGADTISELAYESRRDELIRADKARNGKRSTADLVLPSRNQIISYAGSWKTALTIAGMAILNRGGTEQTAKSILDCLELYIDTTAELFPDTPGYVASSEELKLFARRSGFSLTKPEAGRPWASYLDELQTSRAARGLKTPSSYAPRRVRAGIVALGLTDSTEPRRRDHWNAELCIEGLQRWERGLPAAAKRTQRAYQVAAASDANLPALSAIQRHCGSFAAARDEAMRLNRL